MDSFINDFIVNTLTAYPSISYLTVFVLLIWCGVGFPLPEDIILITAGYMVFKDSANLYVMTLVAFVGVLAGDIFIYYVGRKFGLDIITHKRFRRILNEAKLVKIEKMFNRYGTSIVFFGRFLAFLRAPVYLSSGALGVRFSTFVFYDFMASLVSIPLIIMIGYYFGEYVEIAFSYVRKAEYLVIVLVLIGLLFVIRRIRYTKQIVKEKAKLKEEKSDDKPSDDPGIKEANIS